MLARRFTIVCLLAAVFGISFSNLVANSARRTPAWTAAPCGFACTIDGFRV